MTDNPDIRGPRDRAKINVHQRWEVDYWTGALNVTEDELREAVQAVGTSAERVREHLAGARAVQPR